MGGKKKDKAGISLKCLMTEFEGKYVERKNHL